MKEDLVLVVGATGTVGSQVMEHLKKEGYRVRGTTSKPSKSKELVQVNLVTGEGIVPALEGVDRAFFISPPGYANQQALLSPLIQEAKRRGLKKVVLMTALGANANENSPFRKAEIELEKSGLTYNIVRPNWFFQNFNTFWIKSIREQGKILLPAGTAKTSFIDARDIAEVVTSLLVKNDKTNQAIDITGPQSIDHERVASAISRVTGNNVIYREIRPEEFREGLLLAGLPSDYTDFLVMIMGFLREGYNAKVNDNVRDITGHEPRNLETYVNDYKKAWL